MPVIDLGSVVGPQGPQGVAGQTGATGATGAAGPNQVTGSTNTTLNGVLQGNGSKVSALPTDSSPISGSNNIVRSGAIYNALQVKPNKNLFRNWYFVGGGTGQGVFPFNFRGETTYTEAGFSINAWYLTDSRFNLTVTTDYIRWERTSSGSTPSFQQQLYLPSQTYTISILYRTNFEHLVFRNVTGSAYIPSSDTWTLFSQTFTGEILTAGIQDVSTNAGVNEVGRYIDIKAMKFEVGTMQTLAHLESGVWVLNEIPDYDEELFRTEISTEGSSPFDAYTSHHPAYTEMIAPIVVGDTPSSSISSGKLFVWHGYLYKSTATISTTTPINPGTGGNCTRTTLAAELGL